MATKRAGVRERHIVFAPTWIGDSAMAAPFFASLRTALPEARIEAVASPWTEGLLGTYPWIDRVHVLGGEAGRGKWRSFISARRRMGREQVETAWLLPNSFRSAVLAWWMGARCRIGYATDGRGWLLSRGVVPPPSTPPPHLVDYYLGLLEAEGFEPAHRSACLPVSREAGRFADELLARLAPGGEGPLVGLNPGAFYGDSKTWPTESFGVLAGRLSEELGARVLVFGGRGEAPLAERVVAAAGGAAVSLAGRDTLASLHGILVRLRVFISGDTGPLHVAALVGTPTVSLFGPTDPRRTAPRGPRHRVVRREMDCSPCFARTCPLGHHRCMQEISPEQVAAEVRILLRETGRIAVSGAGGEEGPPPGSREGA